MNKNIKDTLLYSNLTFINPTIQRQPATAIQTRSDPIIQVPEDYTVSVIRFDIDAHSLPLNFPQTVAQIGPQSFSTTSFITLKYNNVLYTQNVIYVEDSLITAMPPRATIYNYQRWLDFVNAAAALAFTASGSPGAAPLFIFDPVTQLINLYVDQHYMSTTAPPARIEIFINEPLYLYLTNFPYLFGSTSPFNTLIAYKFDIIDSNIRVMPAVGSRQFLPQAVQTIPTLFLFNQLADGMASWNSIRSIILTTAEIPIKVETIQTNPQQFQNYNSDSSLKILSDFILPTSNEVTLDRNTLQYLPTAEYRRLQMSGTEPLKKLDVSAFYTDFTGRIFPLLLIQNTGISIKLLFEKKNL